MKYTPLEDISEICNVLNLDYNKVTNVYNYGSHTLGNQTLTSDFDILIVGDFEQEPLHFKLKNDPYFYDFEMKKHEMGGRLYDIIWHSNENFEKLLELNFLMFVEAVFNDSKYHQINKVDYKKMYIDKFYSIDRLRKSLVNEHGYSYGVYKKFRHKKLNYGLDGKWVIKKLYNALRYYTTVSGFISNICINGIFEFVTFGKELNEFKISILNKYDQEGDTCVDDVASVIFKRIKTNLDAIKQYL